MGAPSHAIFKFLPRFVERLLPLYIFTHDVCSARPLDMDIHLQSFTIPHFPSLMIAMSKPVYLAIVEHSSAKPVIIFVSSRRQCRLSMDNILTHCSTDEKPDHFLNIKLEDLQPHLDHIRDAGLIETLKHGIGYFHEALSQQDKRIVQCLFKSGAIQVLVVSKVHSRCLSF
jgi:pre-mRNA-splicing helicase BRR2